MKKEFFRLEEVLKSHCSGRPVYYYPNPGNWGDAVIGYGERQFFRNIGLRYSELEYPKSSLAAMTSWAVAAGRRAVLIHGGGGAWGVDSTHAAERVQKVHRFFSKVIVMPSSYALSIEIPNGIFFRRDQFESKQNMPDSIFCHDMAFFIGPIKSQDGTGTGNFFRTDGETSGKIDVPNANYDVSWDGDHNSGIYGFVNAISRYSHICTDRMHVGIVSCLLGRKLDLYGNNYFKIRAVYNSTIEPYFRNVTFHDIGM